MSAFVVDNVHINAILTYAVQNKMSYWCQQSETRIRITVANAEEIGRILMDENVRSVVHRYQDSSPNCANSSKDCGSDYKFRMFRIPLTAIEVIKACRCLDYQCCETDDWETTLACQILQSIISQCIHYLSGYDAAPWEITADSVDRLHFGPKKQSTTRGRVA